MGRHAGAGATAFGSRALILAFSGTGVEQQAYITEALVLEDMRRDRDGIFTCPLGECDEEGREWSPSNLGCHNCVKELALCGSPAAPDYCGGNDNCPDSPNPDQADGDGDGRGDACDPLCPGGVNPRPFEDLDNDCILDGGDNCPCDPAITAGLANCEGGTDCNVVDGDGCFQVLGCGAFANPDQADNDRDGAGDVCDPDDDDDGLSDTDEIALGTDPFDSDSDDDGLDDGSEVLTYGTDPKDADSDDDGLTDGSEVLTYGTDPKDGDTDDDNLSDGNEIAAGTDPLDPDSDDDGYDDGSEVAVGCDALDSLVIPPQGNAIPGIPGEMVWSVLLTWAEPRSDRVFTSSDPSCADIGTCDPSGFCRSGRIGDPCTTSFDCDLPPDTCRAIVNYANVPGLTLAYAWLNGQDISGFGPPAIGCARKVDLMLDPARRTNRLRVRASGTINGLNRRDVDAFQYRQ